MADPIATLRVHADFRDAWASRRDELVDGFVGGRTSFVPGLLPEDAVRLPGADVLEILHRRCGTAVEAAVDEAAGYVDGAPAGRPAIRGPYASEHDGRWLAGLDIVGVNVRTVGTFWDVVKYALTVPAARSGIHLLPIWEPGVVDSLYGPSSWNLNREFFSPELARLAPGLDTVERQLRAVVNLFHVAGRAVGMDVLPHCDRFSEMVLAQPRLFEWLQREGPAIVRHGPELYPAVEQIVERFLAEAGTAVPGAAVPPSAADLRQLPEAARLQVLFGQPDDPAGRFRRRNALIRRLHEHGLEPVPATMGPPYRGLAVDDRAGPAVDAEGMEWRDFRITDPTPMSRVFGPLARYHLYETMDADGDGWALDFDRPREEAWRYVCDHYAEVQRRYGFDFMRGDMAHVQMRPEGVVARVGDRYDILGAVLDHVRATNGAPFFASLAESFLAPRDVIGYGEEIDHLEAAGADVVLGDLQSVAIGAPLFSQRLRQYDDWAAARRCTPCLTVMTGDKDDPRFDEFYRRGNEARLFVALFLPGMPTYMALGFETRDVHATPAPNEHYTKLYVFHATGGPTATQGPYVWGRNGHLFAAVTRMRLLREEIGAGLDGRRVEWLLHPDPTGERRVIAWTTAGGPQQLLFVANLDTERASAPLGCPPPRMAGPGARWEVRFSTLGEMAAAGAGAAGAGAAGAGAAGVRAAGVESGAGAAGAGAAGAGAAGAESGVGAAASLVFNGVHLVLPPLAAGEGRLYRLVGSDRA